MRECPTVRVTVPNPPPVVSVPVQVPPVIKLAGGVRGKDGTDGVDGVDGVGVPAGGTTRQALVKASDADYDTSFETLRELPDTPTTDVSEYGGEYVLTTNAGTPPAWETRGRVPMPGAPAPEGAVSQFAWGRGLPLPTWHTTPYIPYIGPGPGLPRHTLIVGDGGSYRWVKEDPIPALPVESGQFLGIQDGQLAWLHPIPPATATTVPQALTIPATTPVEDARNLYPNPTAVAGGAGWINDGTGGSITLTGNGYELTRGSTGTFSTEAVGLTAGTIGAYYSIRAKITTLTANLVGKHIYLALHNGSIFIAGSPDVSAGVYPPLGQSVTVTLPATLAADTTGLIRPYLYLRAGAVSGDSVLLNEIDVRRVGEAGLSVAGDFFTGDTPDTETHQYGWAGAPYRSANIRYTMVTTVQWAPTIPPPPPTGTHVLTSVDGVMAWVAN